MKITGELPLSREKIQTILDSPMPYTKSSDVDEANLAKDLAATLSDEELEVAAQSSYAYWLASVSDKPPTNDERLQMATREARRHIAGQPYEKACQDIKDTIQNRKDRRIDLLRSCFLDGSLVEYDSKEDEEKATKLKSLVESDLVKQLAFVRGRSKEGYAILVLMARTGKGTDEDAFVNSILYTMERAVASTENLSEGTLEKIVVVLDFGGFKSSLAPTTKAIKAVAGILQHRYPERLKNLVILDPPFWMRTLYGLISPFLDPETKAKFIMASGKDKKIKVLSDFVDPDQAMPFMLPSGKLTDPVELDYYVNKVPFHCGYEKNP